MIAKLRKVETTAANESLVSETLSREASMITEHADGRMLEQHDPSGRRLRNRIIVANAIAWIAIIALIRLVFL
jgi:aspartate oxidase